MIGSFLSFLLIATFTRADDYTRISNLTGGQSGIVREILILCFGAMRCGPQVPF